jgi:hypothetical protein
MISFFCIHSAPMFEFNEGIVSYPNYQASFMIESKHMSRIHVW